MRQELPGRSRQLRLFQIENPLTQRLGSAFFRGLPQEPGVYFFRDAEETLLYIGQSADLRARVGSYRHVTPEKNPKRTLRLVARTARIEWQVCATAAEAIRLESELLLKHRPPFNRAGVWLGDPWWLKVEAAGDMLLLELSREAGEGDIGPLPASFRHVHGSLVRCLYRAAHLPGCLSQYPHGLMDSRVPLSLKLPLPEAEKYLAFIQDCAQGRVEALLALLEALPMPASISETEFWAEEQKRLKRHGVKTATSQP